MYVKVYHVITNGYPFTSYKVQTSRVILAQRRSSHVEHQANRLSSFGVI